MGVAINYARLPGPPYPAAVPDSSNYRAAHTVTTHARVCGLCGRPFAILIPPSAEETERGQAVLGVREVATAT
jgi:hypothetical protein